MSAYRETLHKWASQFVPDGAKVTAVEIKYDDGYDPTFTDRPASLDVWISYEWAANPNWKPLPGQSSLSAYQLTSVGELLTALFAIEEAT